MDETYLFSYIQSRHVFGVVFFVKNRRGNSFVNKRIHNPEMGFFGLELVCLCGSG